MSEEEEFEAEQEEEEDGGQDGGQEAGEEEEDGEKPAEIPLMEDMMSEALSLLCKIGSGLAHAYVRCDLKDRELTDINLIKRYIHVRYLDVSKNRLKSVAILSGLESLLLVNASDNQLNAVKLKTMPYLQILNLSSNKLAHIEGVNHPLLEQLVLSFNEIVDPIGLNPDTLSLLHTLDLKSNQIESLINICLPNLKNLYIASNMLKKLQGIEKLTSLEKLHVRENQIDELVAITEANSKLAYINLRGNQVPKIKELAHLQKLPSLRMLMLSDNPVCDEDDYRLETLILLKRLVRLDKDEVSEDERHEADEISNTRSDDVEVEEHEEEGG